MLIQRNWLGDFGDKWMWWFMLGSWPCRRRSEYISEIFYKAQYNRWGKGNKLSMIPSLCIRHLRGPYGLLLKLGIHKEEPFEEKRAWSTFGSGGGLVTKLCLIHGTPWTVACHVPLSMGFSRQEYWIGLLFPSPGDLPEPRIKPRSPALQTDSLKTDWTTREALKYPWYLSN